MIKDKFKEILLDIEPKPTMAILQIPFEANPCNVDFDRLAKVVVEDFLKNEKEILIDDIKGQIKQALKEEENFQHLFSNWTSADRSELK